MAEDLHEPQGSDGDGDGATAERPPPSSTAVMNEAADRWEVAATKKEFTDAVRHAGERLKVALPEAAQRRLFGLHARAIRGVPPASAPPGQEEEHWKAWSEAGDLSALAAMQEYIDVLVAHDPSFLEFAESDGEAEAGERPGSELPEPLRQQLAGMGFKQLASKGEAHSIDADPAAIFDAIRGGGSAKPFLPAGANLADDGGLTPLLHAVDAENVIAALELLAAGADVNRADPQGQAPVHYAALLGNEVLVKALVAAGADLALRDEDGKTAAEVAADERHAAVAELLSTSAAVPSAA